ncbi:hypothetical protein NQ317_000104 [Molorchus minor]|uniref:Uncharacterized protein n=1 Tax=Molorchus minor TaxID=1323400 RepID=A0ABQ9IZX7_9CUCU|nr:hypothetical protein NQ317_000104 [Molorchus minor]
MPIILLILGPQLDIGGDPGASLRQAGISPWREKHARTDSGPGHGSDRPSSGQTLARALYRTMDQLMKFVEPGRQFAKDSIRLVKKMHKTRQARISKNCHCHCHWFLYHGIHRILCQTYSYTHQ